MSAAEAALTKPNAAMAAAITTNFFTSALRDKQSRIRGQNIHQPVAAACIISATFHINGRSNKAEAVAEFAVAPWVRRRLAYAFRFPGVALRRNENPGRDARGFVSGMTESEAG
jgi:hypothetical protein